MPGVCTLAELVYTDINPSFILTKPYNIIGKPSRTNCVGFAEALLETIEDDEKQNREAEK